MKASFRNLLLASTVLLVGFSVTEAAAEMTTSKGLATRATIFDYSFDTIIPGFDYDTDEEEGRVTVVLAYNGIPVSCPGSRVFLENNHPHRVEIYIEIEDDPYWITIEYYYDTTDPNNPVPLAMNLEIEDINGDVVDVATTIDSYTTT